MFKIFVGLLVIGSGSVLGYFASLKFYFRIKELRELQESMNFIKNEIFLLNSTIPDIFKKLASKNNLRISILFRNVVAELSKDKYISIENAWNYGLWESLSEISLKSDDLDIINNMGLMLEKSDSKAQLENIEYLHGRLKCQEEKAIDSKNKNEKLVKIGGFLGGAVLVILLF